MRIWRWLTSDFTDDGAARVHRRAEGDSWQTYDFLAPGVLLMHTAVCPAGTAARFGHRPPDLSQVKALSENFTSQAVTPMTDRTSRYFFSWGPRAEEGSDALADAMLQVAHMAFGEDKAMIEAQQRSMDMAPGQKEVLTSADVGPMQMRAVLQRLMREEGSGAEAAA